MSTNMISRLALGAICLMPIYGQAISAQSEAQVIVKFRPDSLEVKHAQVLERTRNLSGRLGLAMQPVHEPAPGMQVLRARGVTSSELARQLSLLPEVDYAVPDRVKRMQSIPNDPLYADQWYLQAVQPAALNAVSAWDRLLGGMGPIVAIIDSGIRPDHPDLVGKIVPGYDFISHAHLSGDGDGRDNDPSDPGDYITPEEAENDLCGGGTQPSYSSWHGTRVAGIIAATTNNNVGIAGISRNGRILPLRVLGKCGSYDSDIIAAMRWAAGLSVPGAPANANPARVINLSIAGPGSCSSAYKEAIKEVTAQGAVIMAAAGNNSGAVQEPANCAGVMAVAGLRHSGTKVDFSNFGPQIGISAAAGNCVNTGPGQACEFIACLFPINTTTNLGLTVPGANCYTNCYNNYNLGTSFATPQAAGVAALMLEVHPDLSASEIMRRMKAVADTFPIDPALPTCPNLGAAGSGIDGQCNCTTSTCGAGMLDADKSVAQAVAPEAAIAALDSLVPNGLIRLDSTTSTVALGRYIMAWNWTLVDAPSGASLINSACAMTTLQSTTGGDYRISLEVRDNLGASSKTETVLSIDGGDHDGGGGGGGSLGLAEHLGLIAIGLLACLPGHKLKS